MSKTGTPYLYANGNPSTLSDPSVSPIRTATICTGVDGIGCVNKTTAKGYTRYQLTPNGDVVSAVAYWQGWKPFDYTDEWVKANGNAIEKRIGTNPRLCGWRLRRRIHEILAILLAGGSVAEANAGWSAMCDSIEGLCRQMGALSL